MILTECILKTLYSINTFRPGRVIHWVPINSKADLLKGRFLLRHFCTNIEISVFLLIKLFSVATVKVKVKLSLCSP